MYMQMPPIVVPLRNITEFAVSQNDRFRFCWVDGYTFPGHSAEDI